MIRLFRYAVIYFGLFLISVFGEVNEKGQRNDEGMLPFWRSLSQMLYEEARTNLGNLEAEKKIPPRDLKLARATLLLNLQPRTSEGIDTASKLLDEILAESRSDETAIYAEYLRARMEYVHKNSKDSEAARLMLSRFVKDRLPHRLAQFAVPKLAILSITGDLSANERMQRYEEMKNLYSRLDNSMARRDMAQTLALLALYYDLGKREALNYSLDADALGMPQQEMEVGLTLRIGLLAGELGETGLAIRYFQKFQDNYPNDKRRRYVQDILSKLQKRVKP